MLIIHGKWYHYCHHLLSNVLPHVAHEDQFQSETTLVSYVYLWIRGTE